MNDYRAYVECDYNSLYHFGVRGQKWGIRRYQNPDGTLTPEGKKRYLNSDGTLNARGRRELKKSFGVKSSAGKLLKGAAGTAGAAAIAKEYGSYGFRKMAEKEKDNFLKARKNVNFVEAIGLEDRAGKMHKVPVNTIAKNYEDAYNKVGWYDWKAGKYKYNPVQYRLPNEMTGFKHIWKRPVKADDFMDDIKRIEAKAVKRRKALVAGVLAAGVGITAISIYRNERRKKAMRDRGEERVKQLFGEDFVYDPNTKQYVSRKK